VIFDAILNGAPISPVRLNLDLPPRLEEIINKTLEKDPDLRCQTASELRSDLKRLKRDMELSRAATVHGSLAASTDSATVASLPVTTEKRHSTALMGLGIVVCLTIGLALGRVIWKSGPPEPPLYHQITFRRGALRAARFAPDGKMIVYSAA